MMLLARPVRPAFTPPATLAARDQRSTMPLARRGQASGAPAHSLLAARRVPGATLLGAASAAGSRTAGAEGGGKKPVAPVAFFALLGTLCLACLASTLKALPLFPFQLSSLPWLQGWLWMTVVDYYGAVLPLCGIIVASERPRTAALWSLAVLFLGSPFCCAYVALRLRRHHSLRLRTRSPATHAGTRTAAQAKESPAPEPGAPANFSGEWAMDLAASDSLAPLLKEMEMNFMLAAVIERLAVSQTITQDNAALNILVKTPLSSDEVCLPLDGSPSTITSLSGGKTRAVSRWTGADKQQLETRQTLAPGEEFVTVRSLQQQGMQLWEEVWIERDGVLVGGTKARRTLCRVQE